jgi:polysaccharide export outer membrane protein
MRPILLVAILPLLAACLPASGPSTSAIISAGDEAIPQFDVVDLDASIADVLAARQYESFAATFGEGGGAPDLRIGVGDRVVVTIFEAASGGLFSGEPGATGTASKSVSLPPQPVARNGMISVPYVGQVRAAGATPAQVQGAIEAALRDKAIEPQVLVTVQEGASTFVTVAGDVGAPGRIPLNLDGDRILDVVATAGGAKESAYDTFVRLTRGSQTVTVSLERIVENPGQNIYLRPDDQLYLITDPQIFTAFGASRRNETFPFQTDRLTLAEALGRAGGLLDSRANPRGVFVFRYERPELYAMIRGNEPPPATAPAGVPVVYRVDLREPAGFFVTQRFLMRDNDVLYISNAPFTDVEKIMGAIGAGVGLARTGMTFENAIDDD